MPSLSAFQYESAQAVLDAIESQFRISEEKLIEITKGFLEEFEEGLSHYGKDMAMM